ncbi:MAG: HAD hydrolase family protein [Atopobiaceae bacterium]|nr:HAD hydrolase family protein [Atopobiaceae bacterium]
MTNILFLDIDGTLLATKDGRQVIPTSATEAIEKARRQGARAYLCTGRSLAEVRTLGDLPVDGVIGAAGSYVLDGETMVYHQGLDRDDVEAAERFLSAHGAYYYLESTYGMYFDDMFLDFALREWGIRDPDTWLKIVHPVEEANRDDVNKICFRCDDGGLSFEDVVRALGDRFYLVHASYGRTDVVSGEMSRKGVNKGTAIRCLLEHLGLDEVRTYGFGDSANDIEMLDACDEAIVMGDARDPRTLEHATYVTAPPLEDGIAKAIRHFGLIG